MTGGAGFIGSHLVEKLLAASHDVVVLDDFNDFYDPQIKHANIAGFVKDVTVYHVDLRDSESVRNLFHREKVDVITHLAARAGVPARQKVFQRWPRRFSPQAVARRCDCL